MIQSLSAKLLTVHLIALRVAQKTRAVALPHVQPTIDGCASILNTDDTQNGESNGINGSGGTIISNFQDLSAVVSLFAADAVEEKICTPSTQTWERMSCVWSIFGILGLGRAYIKFAVGLSGAEAAGFRLNGAGTFTSRRTKAAFKAWPIGSSHPGPWSDDRGQLIQNAYITPGTWKKPLIVVHGYLQCPARWEIPQFRREVWGHVLISFLTVVLALGPLAFLWSFAPSNIGVASLAVGALGSLAGGCALPILLASLNDVGVASLCNPLPRGLDSMPLSMFQSGDLVISTPEQRIIVWQDSIRRRSGDLVLVRGLAVLSLLTILAKYILNYILLGKVPARVSYIWFAIQITVMGGRYWLWAYKPNLIPMRHRTLVYTVMGSLHDKRDLSGDTFGPLPAGSDIAQESRRGERSCAMCIPQNLVKVSLAAACSKLTKNDAPTTLYKLDALLKLADKAPRDLLLAHFLDMTNVADATNPEEVHPSYRVVILPWAFIEELYLFQGLLLGSNPLLQNQVLAAILNSEQFIGLTTVKYGEPNGYPSTGSIFGITAEGFEVLKHRRGGALHLGRLRAPDIWQNPSEHHKIWKIVMDCRNAAVSNGNTQFETHAVCEGSQSSPARTHIISPDYPAALAGVMRTCFSAGGKMHDDCGSYCLLPGLIPDQLVKSRAQDEKIP